MHFAFLAKLAAELGLKSLSMGMSDDFETAIAFGATHVRVGSAIFGIARAGLGFIHESFPAENSSPVILCGGPRC